MVSAINPAVIGQVQAQMAAVRAATEKAAADTVQQLQQSFAGSVVSTFADALGAGFQAAIASGKIGEGFKAFGAVMLSGLGEMLQQFGKRALLANKLILGLMKAMGDLNPVGGIAASLALIALGGALKGAAQSAFGGGGAPPPLSAGAIGGGAGGTTRLPGLTFGPTSSATAGSLTTAAPVNVTIIGPNDPSAQRQMQELIANAQRRGNV
jgi:hypothetical protein